MIMSRGNAIRIVFSRIGFFSIVMCLFLACGKKPELGFESERLGERVITYQSLGVRVTAVASQKGLVVIDTHRSPYTMKILRQRIEKDFGRNDFAFVVNTHGDWDHSSGNQVFPEAEIIGHEKCPEFMRQYPANSPRMINSLQMFLDGLKRKPKKPAEDDRGGRRADAALWKEIVNDLENNYTVTPPTKTFRDTLVLDLGDLTLKLWYAGRSHTNNSILIAIPEEKIVWTGDLFTSGNGFGFSVNALAEVPMMLSALDHILYQTGAVRHVVPGHGEIFSGDDLIRLKSLLAERWGKCGISSSVVLFLERLIEKYGIDKASRKFDEILSGPDPGLLSAEEEFNTLGQDYLGQGRIKEAVLVFQKSTGILPNSALCWDNLGEAYTRAGDTASAITSYEKSLHLFPRNANAGQMIDWLSRGIKTPNK
jgi:glyoxylase-like metal-dependent hydrolase (beta-lactamase superfamily II)